MTNKKIIFVLALFLVLFVAVGAVSAADNLAANDGQSNQVNGTFADLKSIIDSSAAGSTIILDKNYVYSDSDINLIEGIPVNNALTIDGNGFTIDGSNVSRIFQVGNNIVLKNINFKNANQIGAGGAIYAGTISNFKLINCTFTNCNATGNGVVYLNKVTGFTLNDCKFINCNVIGRGGAIYIGTATDCNFNCSDFTNCTCDPIYTTTRYGGAIYISSATNCNFNNCTYTNCSAPRGSGGAISISSATDCTLSGCDFTNCNSIGGTVNNGASGGAVNFDEAINTLTITQCSFTNCESTAAAGAVYIVSAYKGSTDFTLNNCIFEDCDSNSGKAVYYSTNTKSTLTTDLNENFWNTNSDQFEESGLIVGDNTNKKPDNWVVIAFDDETSTVKFVLNDGSDLTGPMPNYEVNITVNYVNGTSETITRTIVDNKVTVDDIDFRNLTVSTKSGEELVSGQNPVYVSNSGNDENSGSYQHPVKTLAKALELIKDNGKIIFFGGETYILSNAQINKAVTIKSTDGTAVLSGNNVNRILTINADNVVINDLTFTNGNSSNGGAVYVAEGASLTADNVKFINNTVKPPSGDPAPAGAAICSYGNLLLDNCVFDGNKVNWTGNTAGGAIYQRNTGKYCNITNSNFTNNGPNPRLYNDNKEIGNVYGGAVDIHSTYLIDNCIFDNNTGRWGVVLLAYNEGIINNTLITNSYVYQGNLYLDNSNTKVYNTNITNSVAEVAGSGNYKSAGSAVMIWGTSDALFDNCNIVNNRDSGDISKSAFGTFNIADGAVANIIIKDSLFKDNSAVLGGAIHILNYANVKCNMTINNTKFINNKAVYSTGGAISYGATANNKLSINDCTFIDNSANNLGGAIYSMSRLLEITNTNFTNCYSYGSTPASSSAISMISPAGSTANASISGCIFTDCKNVIRNSANFNLNDSVFTGSTGYVIYNSVSYNSKYFSMDNVTIKDNGPVTNVIESTESTGGTSTITINNSDISNNTATGYIISVTGGTATIENTAFANNAVLDGVVISDTGTTKTKKLTLTNNEFIGNEIYVAPKANFFANGVATVNAVVESGVNSVVSGNTFKENDNKCIFHNQKGATADFSGEANIVENNGVMKEGSLEGYIENDGTINGGTTELINKYVAVTVDEGKVTTKVGFAARLATQSGNIVINDNAVTKLALSCEGEGNNYTLNDTEVTDETESAFASYSVKDQVFNPTADHPEPYITTLSAESSSDYKNDTGEIIAKGGTLKDLQDIIKLIPENGTLYIYGNYSYADEDSAIEINKTINIISLNGNTITADELDTLFVVKKDVTFCLSDLTVAAKDNGIAIDMSENTTNAALNNVTFNGKNITVVKLGSASILAVTNCTATDGIVKSVDGATIFGEKLVITVTPAGDKYTITADATVDGLYIKGLNFKFTANSKVIGAARDAGNGTYYLNDVDFEPGTYVISADLDAEITNATVTKPVPPAPTHDYKLSGDNVTKFVNGTECYTVTLTDNGKAVSNEIITISLNNETFKAVTDKNGKATFKLDLPAGNYTVTAKWSNLTIKNTITVKELPHNYKLTANNVTKFVNGTDCYIVTLTDNGKAVSNETIVISLNGETLNATTDKNGKATFKLDLPVGTYNVTAKWNNLTVKNTITVKALPQEYQLTAGDITKYFKGPQRYTVTLTKDNKALSNETITITINGKSYTRVTDENGTASLAINLNVGEYNITASWKNMTVKNTVTVLTTIHCDDFTKYYLNGTQYEAYVLDSVGNPLDGVTITFNIHGVFYTRTAHNGTVKLNINLLPGEYIITAYNDVTGEASSATVTVLPTLTGSDLNMTYKDGSKYECKLVDGQGNPVKGAELTFNIHGVFYHKITDDDGIARLNINLLPGEYIITAIYGSTMTSNIITVRDL